MVNEVTLIGNLGADPEVRAFESGNNVARFRLATSERFQRDGEWHTISEWHTCECWGRTADVVDEYARSGDRLYCRGSIHYHEYTTKAGEKRTQTIIRVNTVKLLTPRQTEPSESAQVQAEPQPQPQQTEPTLPPAPPIDPRQADQSIDELPF